jgi:hypothetical protein
MEADTLAAAAPVAASASASATAQPFGFIIIASPLYWKQQRVRYKKNALLREYLRYALKLTYAAPKWCARVIRSDGNWQTL